MPGIESFALAFRIMVEGWLAAYLLLWLVTFKRCSDCGGPVLRGLSAECDECWQAGRLWNRLETILLQESGRPEPIIFVIEPRLPTRQGW